MAVERAVDVAALAFARGQHDRLTREHAGDADRAALGRAMELAQRGLAGDFEDDPRLDREGYREIVELLRELGIGARQ